MANEGFTITLRDDNNEVLVNGVFANMALAESFFKKFMMKEWDLDEEDAAEEWEVLYQEGTNDNGDTLDVEPCPLVTNNEDSDELLKETTEDF